MTIDRARELLGASAVGRTDEEIQDFLDSLTWLVRTDQARRRAARRAETLERLTAGETPVHG